MNPKSHPSELREKFCILLRNTSVLSKSRRDYTVLDGTYGNNYASLGWSKKPFAELIDAIAQTSLVSKKTIEREIRQSVIRLFEECELDENDVSDQEVVIANVYELLKENAIQVEFDSLLDRLEKHVQLHTVFVLLTGLMLHVPSISIGEVIIYPNGTGPLIEIMEDRRTVTDSEAEEFEKSEGCYAAIPDLRGDAKFAQERGLDKVDAVTDVLSFYLASCNHRREGFAKIKGGKHQVGYLEIYSMSSSGRPAFSGSLLSHRQYEVVPDMLEYWEKWGLDKIIQCCLGDAEGSTIKGRIKRAVTWYSKAVNADGMEEQAVALSTALECLLVGDEGKSEAASSGSITQRLAERVAFLLGTTYEERTKFEAKVKFLYGLRSKVVHSGRPIPSEELDRMNNIVRSVILAFALKDFSSWDEFLRWISSQKYMVPDALTQHKE